GGNAVKVLKRTLNSLGYSLTVNGTMDTATINAINEYSDILNLYNTYKANRLVYYQDLVDKSVSKYQENNPEATQAQINSKTLKKYLNGWTNRVNKFSDKTSENTTDVNC